MVEGTGLPRTKIWRDARVVEWACLENRYVRKGIGGSNPSPAVSQIWCGVLRKTGVVARRPEVRILPLPKLSPMRHHKADYFLSPGLGERAGGVLQCGAGGSDVVY